MTDSSAKRFGLAVEAIGNGEDTNRNDNVGVEIFESLFKTRTLFIYLLGSRDKMRAVFGTGEIINEGRIVEIIFDIRISKTSRVEPAIESRPIVEIGFEPGHGLTNKNNSFHD